MEVDFLKKMLFSLLGGLDHRTRHGCLKWLSLIKGHPATHITNHITINCINRMCDAYRIWVGIIHLTHKSHFASITELQNWLRGAGDIELIYQKETTINWTVPIRYGDAWHGRDASIGEWKSMYTSSSSIIAIKMEVRRGYPGGLRHPYLIRGHLPTPKTTDTPIS